MSLDLTIAAAVQTLSNAEIDRPWREVRLLLAHCLRTTYEEIFFQLPETLSVAVLAQFENLIKRRAAHEPFSKIIGCREFWGLPFKVTVDTLDPRPDSETLVESVLEFFPDRQQPYRILDLGTGTGCLLISLLREYPHATGVGVDISEKALTVAKENGNSLLSSDRCHWLCADWAHGLSARFDIIVSNPPYIAENEMLPKAVRDYDPSCALFGGSDGLSAYRTLVSHINSCVKIGGKLFFEIGAGQIEGLKIILEESKFQQIEWKKDLQGHIRVAIFACDI